MWAQIFFSFPTFSPKTNKQTSILESRCYYKSFLGFHFFKTFSLPFLFKTTKSSNSHSKQNLNENPKFPTCILIFIFSGNKRKCERIGFSEPEEEGTELKARLVREASWKSEVDRSNHSCLDRSPLILSTNAYLAL